MTGRKSFNFKLIGIGLIFLIDFNINTVDILPDFIGLILIYSGIGKASYFSEDLLKAKKYLGYFIIASLVKSAGNIFYFIYGQRVFDDSLILLLTVLFSGLEFIFCIFIFADIFKSLESFFQLSGKMAHAKKSDYMFLFLKIFIILKIFLAVAIQAPVLITEVAWDRLSIFFGVYLDGDFVKNLLIPPGFIIQGLSGIFTLVEKSICFLSQCVQRCSSRHLSMASPDGL